MHNGEINSKFAPFSSLMRRLRLIAPLLTARIPTPTDAKTKRRCVKIDDKLVKEDEQLLE